MSAQTLVRPAMLVAAALMASASLSGCEAPRNDGHMFQRWADKVEDIKVDDGATSRAPSQTADPKAPLDPVELAQNADVSDAPALRVPMKIDVVDRINMPSPDAAAIRSMLKLVHASVVTGPPPAATEVAGLRRPIESGPVTSRSSRLVQLAAFTTDADARAAWRKFASADPAVFATLAPRFERANLGDKGEWVRVKVALPTAATAAHRVCAAAKLSPERCA
ncbi:MAG TPA: SPOR domain-containing protein [Caulobacteraceae bacterium]|nr:SPOR domain-containing protein [Caulobacteraceae bacterium]